MPNSKFFKKSGPYSITQIAEKFGCEVVGNKEVIIKDLAPLGEAEEGDISFLHNQKYVNQLKSTKASACIISEKDIPVAPSNLTLLITGNPYLLYAKVAQLFYPEATKVAKISDRASISAKAKIGENVVVEDFAVISENVIIGDHCYIGPNTYVGHGVEIGNNTTISSNVTLTYALIGKNCIIHSGVRVGQDGYGFAYDERGITKVPQLGLVIIGNNVEIGANTCIDRGAIENTIIGDNTKLDNLVQLGHNVVIGKNCFIVSQVGIAGSTNVGDGVMIGGQAGIAGHLSIGDQAKVAAKSGIMQDIEKGQMVGGIPGMNIRDWHRITAKLKKMIKGNAKNE